MAALSEKVLVLGIDGADPVFLKRCMDKGLMPNFEKFIKRGSITHDCNMIGGTPTVTPPMWTTLATGAHPSTHGIVDYYRQGDELDTVAYNFDSRYCKAEPMWNVTAEAGIKTLVWHWPGSSWPPTSDSENLYVVDGTQPGGPNVGVAEVDGELLVIASAKTKEVTFKNKAAADSNVPCMIAGMDVEDAGSETAYDRVHAAEVKYVKIDPEERLEGLSDTPMDVVYSPIKPATGWENAPEGAKEFTILNAKGYIRRPALVLKGEDGKYDKVAIYKSKKEAEPMIVINNDEFVRDFVDETIKNDDRIMANRNMRLLEVAEDGDTVRLWISATMDFNNDTLWHPHSLLQEINDNVGYPQPVSMAGGSDPRLIRDCCGVNWDQAAQWNAESIKYLIKTHGFKVVYSHFHNVDLQGHLIVAQMKNGKRKLTGEQFQELFEEVYAQTDRYLGSMMPLLDEGWSIIIVSDHGQTTPEHTMSVINANGGSVNATFMRDWGYTVMVKDENGNDTREIDWSKTTAVLQRCGHILINLKGRNKNGIVDPADKYDLEEKIITDLYSLKDPETGYRTCHAAFRRKDAIVIGSAGGVGDDDSGDIIVYVAEGYTNDHGDSLAIIDGAADTSVRSIFLAAGAGIKEGLVTDRVIRHVDVTPTVAALLGTRMPAEAEGAPIYQILKEYTA